MERPGTRLGCWDSDEPPIRPVLNEKLGVDTFSHNVIMR